MRETWDIGGGWQARLEVEELQPRLILYRHRRRVYSVTTAPKMTDEAILGLAQQIAAVYDTAWTAGWEECRRVIIAAAEEQSALVDEEGGGLYD